MIAIADYNLLLTDLSLHCTLAFEKVIVARTEEELAIYIANITDYSIVGIIPSSDTIADGIDNIVEVDTIIIYVVKPVSDKDRDINNIVNEITIAQQYIKDIKKRLTVLYDDFSSPINKLVRKIDFNSMHTDPEYKYLGCDGYSLSFTLPTDWF